MSTTSGAQDAINKSQPVSPSNEGGELTLVPVVSMRIDTWSVVKFGRRRDCDRRDNIAWSAECIVPN